MAEFRVGTSGYSYKAWKGTFYPEKLPQKDMLRYYSSQLGTVEINNTYYRMPKPALLQGWLAQVPASFRFVLKAPQRITHIKRLKACEDDVAYFHQVAQHLGDQRGPTLYQLPPNLKCDLPRLEALLTALPACERAAFEFRHPTWLVDEVYAALRTRGAALCVADVDEADASTPRLATAPWGYLRLRREAYSPAALTDWATWIRGQGFTEAYVFFKHEDGGAGPAFARRLTELLAAP
ncbi:MAG TPA: DUF72 domain-containing protein [Myxococcota bacterium]|nr:DUF72 domain-containing protein [Myxococcota bacterium]